MTCEMSLIVDANKCSYKNLCWFLWHKKLYKKKKKTNKSVFAKWKKKVVENIFTVLNVCHFIEENTFKLCLFFLFL